MTFIIVYLFILPFDYDALIFNPFSIVLWLGVFGLFYAAIFVLLPKQAMSHIEWSLCGASLCSGAFCALLGVNEKRVTWKEHGKQFYFFFGVAIIIKMVYVSKGVPKGLSKSQSKPSTDQVMRLLVGMESNLVPQDMRKYNGRPKSKSNSVDAFFTYYYWNLAPGQKLLFFWVPSQNEIYGTHWAYQSTLSSSHACTFWWRLSRLQKNLPMKSCRVLQCAQVACSYRVTWKELILNVKLCIFTYPTIPFWEIFNQT